MNWYREYQAEWKEIIETVARELGRSEQMVEKDTIQSMFLFELAKSELPFVFKGGTSLSKAYITRRSPCTGEPFFCANPAAAVMVAGTLTTSTEQNRTHPI